MTVKHASVCSEWNFCFGNEWGTESGSWLLHISVHLLTSVAGQVIDQLISSAIVWHMQDNQGTRLCWKGLVKGRSCLTSFYDRVTHSADEGMAVDGCYVPGLQKSLWHCVPYHLPGESACSWLGWVCCALAKNLSGWLFPGSGGEWSYNQLEFSHQCSSQGLSIRVSSV